MTARGNIFIQVALKLLEIRNHDSYETAFTDDMWVDELLKEAEVIAEKMLKAEYKFTYQANAAYVKAVKLPEDK